MRALVGRYARDLDSLVVRSRGKSLPFSRLSLPEVHKIVRSIPYKRDTAPVEVVGRPARLLNGDFAGLDCKKKAILIGAWAKRNYVPWRFVASSRRPDRRYHHVFPQLRIAGEWVNADATYSRMRLGEVKRCTAAEVL